MSEEAVSRKKAEAIARDEGFAPLEPEDVVAAMRKAERTGKIVKVRPGMAKEK